MDNVVLIVAIAGLAGSIGLAGALTRCMRSLKTANANLVRFSSVLDVEKEAERARALTAAEKQRAELEMSKLRSDMEGLRKQYAMGFERYQGLQKEVSSLEEDLEDVSYGLYRPHFTYADSESYKTAINKVRERQKALIRSNNATRCGEAWMVKGSRQEGERMVKQYGKLVLRAFNAESDTAIANVSWNNYTVMQTRIQKACDALDKLGTVMQVSLTEEYRDARLEELKLVFEAAEKRQEEREEQRRLRVEQKEEERVQRELQREQEDASRDESRFQKALEKARQELEASIDAEREAMAARVATLEADLATAHERKERAIAQAQLTKVGHVYVISNIGAFGDRVLKIGMTRRLDPDERVKELGDASVPFPFDVHALIYSENAPALEARLHERLWDKRVNWSNDRKEFFRATLDEVGAAVRDFGLEAKFLTIPEAREYRETLVSVEQANRVSMQDVPSVVTRGLPQDPFVDATPQPTV